MRGTSRFLVVAVVMVAGACTDEKPDCKGTSVMCGGTCVSIQSDNTNCGSCGVACGRGGACVSGACVHAGCAAGFHDGGDGACVATGSCSAGHHDDGAGTCVSAGCAIGFHDGGDGACVAVGTCSAGYSDDGAGSCACAAGFRDGGDRSCVPAGSCSPAYHDDGIGTCVLVGCAGGYHDGGDGACVATGTCSVSHHDDGTGVCVAGGCAAGYHDGGNGVCLYDVDALGRVHDDAAHPAWANLHDPLTVRTGGNINVRTGAWIPNPGYFVTGFLPVTPGGTFTTSAIPALDPYGLTYYDAQRRFAPGAGAAGPFAPGQVHAVPAGAYYARFSMQLGHLRNLVVLPGTQTPGHVSTHTVARQSETTGWAGRSLGVQGDSISINRPGAHRGWLHQVATPLHASVGLNASAGGRKMARCLYAADDVTPLDPSSVASVDGLFLFLGTNDFANATPLGAITDPAAMTTTFYGQLRRCVETFAGWKPTLRLILVTPLYRANAAVPNAGGWVLADYAAAIRDVAAAYALPVLDLERESGANAVTASTYFDDGLHPNEVGFRAAVFPVARGLLATVLPSD